MKIYVDRGKCCGFGECVAVAPELFAMGADNRAVALVAGDLSDAQAESAGEAAFTCPAEAIELTA